MKLLVMTSLVAVLVTGCRREDEKTRLEVTVGNKNRRKTMPITDSLTPRELDVVRLLGSGCSYEQVASRLGISPHTVVTHIKNAYRKLDVHTAASAVMRSIQLGLLEAPVLQ